MLIVHSGRILPLFQLRGLGADVRPKLRANLGGIWVWANCTSESIRIQCRDHFVGNFPLQKSIRVAPNTPDTRAGKLGWVGESRRITYFTCRNICPCPARRMSILEAPASGASGPKRISWIFPLAVAGQGAVNSLALFASLVYLFPPSLSMSILMWYVVMMHIILLHIYMCRHTHTQTHTHTYRVPGCFMIFHAIHATSWKYPRWTPSYAQLHGRCQRTAKLDRVPAETTLHSDGARIGWSLPVHFTELDNNPSLVYSYLSNYPRIHS